MPRQTKDVTVEITGHNIVLSTGHHYRGDSTAIPRTEAEEVIARDKSDKRPARIKIVEAKRESD